MYPCKLLCANNNNNNNSQSGAGGTIQVVKWANYLLAGLKNTFGYADVQTSSVQTVTSPVASQYVNSQTNAVTAILVNQTTAQSKSIIGINGLQTAGIGAGSGGASQLGYSFQGNYYDSPMIYSAVLTGLSAGTTYFYKPSDNCNTFSFVMPLAPGTTPSPSLIHPFTQTHPFTK